MGIGTPELLIILVIVILLFGVGRLPEVGNAVGKGIREFRHATKDDEEKKDESVARSSTQAGDAPASGPAPDVMYCGQCGGPNARSANFCAHCGEALRKTDA